MSSIAKKKPAGDGGDETDLLSDTDFKRVAEQIFTMAGIVLEPQKIQMITARLARRLRATGMDCFSAYLDLVESGRDKEEVQQFINAITTNLTSFFREEHHFTHFRTNILDHAREAQANRLRVWSAGCSTGEEPYSIALTLLGAFPQPPPDFKILATDLDTKVLARASEGLYPEEKAGIALSAHKSYAKPTGDGQIQIAPAARRLITFRQLNLLQPWPMSGAFDVIFCRNVLIYFDSETKAGLVNRFAELIRPGGFLYLGHSESILGEHAKFENLGHTTYLRRTT